MVPGSLETDSHIFRKVIDPNNTSIFTATLELDMQGARIQDLAYTIWMLGYLSPLRRHVVDTSETFRHNNMLNYSLY
jgi:hypothetical protein